MACNEAVQNDTIIAQLKKRKSYLRSSEVMELFGGLSRQTLCGWARDGILTAIRIGKDNMFDPADLARFLEARCTTGGVRASQLFEAGIQFNLPVQNRVAQADLGADRAELRKERLRLQQMEARPPLRSGMRSSP